MPLTKKIINNWSDEVLRCRTFGHHWKPTRVAKIAGGYDAYEACEVCGSDRIRLYDNRGRIESTRIRYERGYLAPAGTGRMDSDDLAKVRLLVLQAALAT